jgi:hypothetical protein
MCKPSYRRGLALYDVGQPLPAHLVGFDPMSVLAPATVPPVSDECRLPVVLEANGNVTPLPCPGGGVNALAWQHYESGYLGGKPVSTSRTLALGPSASSGRVLGAMCSDYSNIYSTDPLTLSAEHLAAAYYGWDFRGRDPTVTFRGSGCPRSASTTPAVGVDA